MKTNRREFIGYSATAVAAITTGTSTALAANIGIAEQDPNAAALAELAKTPFASSAMPGMFTSLVDATGFENHNE